MRHKAPACVLVRDWEETPVPANVVEASPRAASNSTPARLVPLFALLLASCTSLAPEYATPSLDLPPEVASEAPSTPWWTLAGDPQLAALIDEALAHNHDLLVAAARVEQARAALGITRADQFPTASLRADALRGRGPLVSPTTDNRFSVEVATSYELDFWGKYRDATAAARELLFASQANREALRLSLASQVAQSWYAFQALSQRVLVAERTLVAQEQELKLQRRRADAGLIGEFELRQREAEVAATAVVFHQFTGAREQQRNALGILLGRTPKALTEGALPAASEAIVAIPLAVPMAGFPAEAGAVPAGLPSTRLLNRPDVQAAEATLRAANARIGVARAAWFPSLTLTANGGAASTELSALFKSGSQSFLLGATLAQTLFDAGRISANVEASKASRDAAVEIYRQTVANAFREILDALAARQSAQAVMRAETTRVAALQETLRLARARYDNGLISQLELLDSERNLLAAQSNLIEARRADAAAIAQVWTALGG
jgi:outer membrane protein, multidrug efflux system